MARRSLQASNTGIEKAKRAFKRKQWTQEYLAAEVGIETRQPIWKFFTGKAIERHIFMEICFQLDLDWQEVAALPEDSPLTLEELERDSHWDIDILVQEVQAAHCEKIQAQSGTIRFLDTAKPIDLEDIYINVDSLENITSRRWLDLSELQNCNLEKLDWCGLGQVYQQRIPVMQAVVTYPKLMVLGKPGAGKTTLLQHIAMKCNQGELLPDKIPIFIKLKNFAEDASVTGDFSLLSYIRQELANSNICEQQVETLLAHGKALILLDGLDELQQEDRDEVVKQIRKLSEEYYKNQLIITCRIAAQQYQFEGFADIEIADLDSSQIEAFAQKWFVNVGKNSREKAKALTAQFMHKLQLSQNQQIRELAGTPLLLHLICSVFQAKSDFPAKRSSLYKQALDILLVRWDQAKGIKRDEVYRDLSLPHKLKLLSQIATLTFEQGHYFFRQSNVQHYIADYLRTLPSAQTDPEKLQLDSEAVLKSIEAQHGLLVERARGIYSFSHLTFQEYLTARSLDVNLNRALSLSFALPCNPPLEQILTLSFALPHDRTLVCQPELQRSLQQLKEQLPALDQGKEKLKEWWNPNSQAWVKKLQSLILQYRNIGHQWQFSKQQKEVLQQYYAANQLLMDCLNSGCEVTSTVREKIEESLLLPMAKINNLVSMFVL